MNQHKIETNTLTDCEECGMEWPCLPKRLEETANELIEAKKLIEKHIEENDPNMVPTTVHSLALVAEVLATALLDQLKPQE